MLAFDHVDTAHWLSVEFSTKEYSGDFTLWAESETAVVDGMAACDHQACQC